jgi:hypothetical protein
MKKKLLVLIVAYNHEKFIISNFLLNVNKFLILISKTIFSYQIYFVIKPQISVDFLFDQTKSKEDNEK